MKKDTSHELAVVKDAIHAETVETLDQRYSSDAMIPRTLSDIYKFARPLLIFIQGFLLFKPDWAKAIGALIAALDVEFDEESETTTKAKPKGKGNGKANTGTTIPGFENQ